MEQALSPGSELKILIVSSKPPYPPTDGGCIATLNLAMGLSDAGVSLTVATMSTPKHPFIPDEVPESIRKKLNIRTQFLDTRIKLLPLLSNLLFSQVPYIYERFISSKFKKFLENILKETSYDIVQLEGLFLCPYIQTIRSLSNAKISFRPHNLEHEVWIRNAHNQTNLFDRKYLNNMARRILNLEKQLINQYDLLVPISVRDSQQFTALGNTKPQIPIPAGFAPYKLPRYEHLEPDVDLNSIGFIGALDWIPNQDGLTWFIEEIWPKIIMTPEGDARTLHVAGRNAPKWLARRLKATPQLVFHGEVANAQEFMMRFPIIIVPLNAGGGMRVKIIEAMMLGRIVITTPTGIEGIEAKHNEHLFVAATPDEYNAVFDRLKGSKSIIRKVSKNASLFALENYCYDKLAMRLVEFYQKNL